MTNRFLPRASAALTNAAGPPTAEWRRFFESLAAQTDNVSLQAEYMALAARVSDLEDDAGASIGLVLGQQSIKHVGVLTSGNVYLTLVGDVDSPGNSYYYGTDALGAKGWHALSLDALSDVDLTTTPPADGDVLTYDLATTSWIPLPAGSGSGDVVGPASAVDDRIATFDGTTGKLIQDGGKTIADLRTPAVQTVTSSATVTPTFSDDIVTVTAQAAALALANPTGTAIPGLGIVIRIKDNGTARAISYDTQYRAIGVTLPTTTVISKTLYLACIWNSTDTTMDVLAVGQEA